MSVKAMTWAWELRALDIYQKMILLRLADHANADGLCYPGKTHLAEFCACSVRKVDSVIRELEAMGLIKVQPRAEGSRQLTNVYYLQMDQLSLFTPGPEQGDETTPTAQRAPRTACPTPPHSVQKPPAQRAPESRDNRHRTVPVGTADAVAPVCDLKTTFWQTGVQLLTSQGLDERKARRVLGKLAKEVGDQDALEILRLAQGRVDAVAFIAACGFRVSLPQDNRSLWQIRAKLGLPFEYADLDDCHAEIRRHLREHPEQRGVLEDWSA